MTRKEIEQPMDELARKLEIKESGCEDGRAAMLGYGLLRPDRFVKV